MLAIAGAAWAGLAAGGLGRYLRIWMTAPCCLSTSDTVRKLALSRLYAIAEPCGSLGSGVIFGVPVVIAPRTSPLVTPHSYASEYVRIATCLPSCELAAPVTRVIPILDSLFSVPVCCGVKSPACLSAVACPVGSSGPPGTQMICALLIFQTPTFGRAGLAGSSPVSATQNVPSAATWMSCGSRAPRSALYARLLPLRRHSASSR